jgi:serine/threonine protein kinase
MANRIGTYEIKEILGKGGMGTVYRAIDLTLSREVALKVINPDLSQNPVLMKRFRNEALAMARLSHPNIVVIYNFSSDANLHYIVMEYVQGKNLSQIIQREGALPWNRAFTLFSQILTAMDYAHKQGIIHRDIKPSNFIVQSNGMVKVTDFGIAKLFGGEELTRAGSTLGTSCYMSPEQILVQPIGVFSDIYSLGITLYEMVTGRVPFSGNSDFEIQRGHLELPPLPPRQVSPHLSHAIETAILKSLEKKPERRFPSVRHFLEALSLAEGAELRQSEEKPSTTRGRGSFHLPDWRNAFVLDEWIARYQNLSSTGKLMVVLTALLLFVILLIIIFSIS